MIEERNMGFDLQKCVCMLMVIYLHEIQYGMKEIPIISLGFSEIIIIIMRSFCIVAVNCFVLISGYFMCLSETHRRYGKLLRLWIQVLFYSLGGYIIVSMIPGSTVQISIKTLVRQSLPLLANQYWFFTVYFVMVMISPLLNMVINNIETGSSYKRKELFVVLIVLFSIIPTINIFGDSFGAQNGFSVVWFSILYLIAGYIRVEQIKISKRLSLTSFVLCAVLTSVVRLFSIRISVFTIISSLLLQYNSILVLIQSVSLFMYFKELKINHRISSAIKQISILSFAVYLMHENMQVRGVLWEAVALNKSYYTSPSLFALKFMIVPVLIFSVAIIIEYFRKSVFSKIEVIIQEKTENGLERLLDKLSRKRLQ